MKTSDTHRAQDDYSDIIDPRMAPEMRAAQFAPFAALSGYEETIEEAMLRQQEEVYARDQMRD